MNEKILDGDTKWQPLENWRGVWAGGNSPLMSVQVEYYLDGNRLTVKRALDDQEYGYTLS